MSSFARYHVLSGIAWIRLEWVGEKTNGRILIGLNEFEI